MPVSNGEYLNSTPIRGFGLPKRKGHGPKSLPVPIANAERRPKKDRSSSVGLSTSWATLTLTAPSHPLPSELPPALVSSA